MATRIERRGRVVLAWCAPRLLAVFAVVVPAVAQEWRAAVERARQSAATRPADALRAIEAVLQQGVVAVDVHLAHAEILLLSGDAAGAGAAIGRARALAERDRQGIDALAKRIDEWSAARAAQVIPPAAAAPSPGSTAASPALASPPQRTESAAILNAGNEKRERGDERGAVDLFVAAVVAAPDAPTADEGKRKIVEVTRQVTERAAKLATSDPAQAAAAREQVLQHADTMHGQLRDPERALEILKSTLVAADAETRQQAASLLTKWIRTDVQRANDAKQAGNPKDERSFSASAANSQIVLAGLGNDDDAIDGFESRCKLADVEQRRKALEAYAAWAKTQWLLAEEALRQHRPSEAAKYRKNARHAWLHLDGCGAHSEAADVGNLMQKSADAAVANAAKDECGARADALAETSEKAEREGRPEKAADALAAAYRNRPDRTALGLKAAQLFEKIGQRVRAARLYEQLIEGGVAEARTHLERLRAAATEAFLAVSQRFEDALSRGALAEAIDTGGDPLAILEPTKLGASRDAIDSGLASKETRDMLAEMGRDLAEGRFAPIASSGEQKTGVVEGPPTTGQPFVAGNQLRMQPIAAGSIRGAKGNELVVSQPFWVTDASVSLQQLGEYQALLGKGTPSASWNTAAAFCLFTTQRERAAGRLPANYAYTLPTEAEWELLQKTSPSTNADAAAGAGEWCLDAVDGTGGALLVKGNGVDPCSWIGGYRVWRSNGPRKRGCLELWQPNCTFRMVLAARPDLVPVY